MTPLAPLLLAVALALQDAPPADSSVGDSLARALEAAQIELVTEHDRVASEEQQSDAALAAAKMQVATISDEFVDRSRALEKKRRTRDALKIEKAERMKAHDSARAAATELGSVLRDAHAKLDDFVGALPPGELRAEQRGVLDAKAPFDAPALFALADSLLREAGSLARFDDTVRDPDGVERRAQILRAGMIFTAYRIEGSSHLGELFAAPSEANGFRFSETLREEDRATLAAAFDAARANPTRLTLPIDVTQAMAPDRRSGTRNLAELLRAGGWVMFPLGALALVAALAMVERWLTLAWRAASREKAVEVVLAHVRAGRADLAEAAAGGGGTVMHALLAALKVRAAGEAAMEHAVIETVTDEAPRLERLLPLLAVGAGVAPMLGLLGTVTGMITTFDMIHVFGSGDPKAMAGGISEALVCTATGLVLAIPILLFHSWAAGRADRILADTQRHANELVKLFTKRSEGGDVHPAP